jgi:hypothetical protein
MADDTRLSQDEFEALVNDIRGDCDRCRMDCVDRLRWMDSIIEALRQERKAFAREREAFRAEREQLAALYQINLRVLNLINAPASKTGERENETDFTSRFTQ